MVDKMIPGRLDVFEGRNWISFGKICRILPFPQRTLVIPLLDEMSFFAEIEASKNDKEIEKKYFHKPGTE